MGSLRGHIRTAIAGTGVARRLCGLLERRSQISLAVVCYHRVLPADERREYFFPELVVSPDLLSQHAAFVAEKFDCRPVQEACALLASGRSAEKPLLAITFDDGYRDNFEFARPILERHGIRATLLVISSLVGTQTAPWYDRLARATAYLRRAGRKKRAIFAAEGGPTARWIAQNYPQVAHGSALEVVRGAKSLGPSLRADVLEAVEDLAREHGWREDDRDGILTAAQLRQLVADGHEIGSHTCSHPILTQLDDNELNSEMLTSRRELEEITGQHVVTVAYPNGDYDSRVIAAARRAGYRYALTTKMGVNPRGANPLALRRIFVSQDRTSSPNGEFLPSLFELELTGVADRLFLRALRRRD